MLARLVSAAALAAGFLAASGCGASLKESRTWDVESGDAKGMEIPAQSKPQTLNIEFASSECDVGVYVFKKDEIKDPDNDLFTAQGSKALGKKAGKSESFTVDVAENTGVWVVGGAGREQEDEGRPEGDEQEVTRRLT